MRLKQYLEKYSITAYQFSKATGIDPAILSRFLNGRAGISIGTALRIIDATSGLVSLRDLVANGTNRNLAGKPDGKSSTASPAVANRDSHSCAR